MVQVAPPTPKASFPCSGHVDNFRDDLNPHQSTASVLVTDSSLRSAFPNLNPLTSRLENDYGSCGRPPPCVSVEADIDLGPSLPQPVRASPSATPGCTTRAGDGPVERWRQVAPRGRATRQDDPRPSRSSRPDLRPTAPREHDEVRAVLWRRRGGRCRRGCTSCGSRDGARIMTTVAANGVTLGVEHFGDAAAPLVLIAGGTTMLSWPDTLCEALAPRWPPRRAIRPPRLRRSTTVESEAPPCTLRDLAADAAALARELHDRPAHLAGVGVGGMVAQVAALGLAGRVLGAYPCRNSARRPRPRSTTTCLIITRRRWTGCSREMPNWSDRGEMAEFAARGAEILGDDPDGGACDRRVQVGPHTWRGAGDADGQPAGMVFAKLDCTPRWRERLSELVISALVVHGRRDPVLPSRQRRSAFREIRVRGCSCSNRRRRRSPMRPPVRSRRRCSRCRRYGVTGST